MAPKASPFAAAAAALSGPTPASPFAAVAAALADTLPTPAVLPHTPVERAEHLTTDIVRPRVTGLTAPRGAMPELEKRFHEQFGTLFADAHRVLRRLVDDVVPKVAADEPYLNAQQNTPWNARVEYDRTLARVMLGLLNDDFEVYKAWADNPPFKHFVADLVFERTRTAEAPAPARRPAVSREEEVQAREVAEMEQLLAAAGYDPVHAARLRAEGMGPVELKDRLQHKPGAVGSLPYTHRIEPRRKTTLTRPETVERPGEPAGPSPPDPAAAASPVSAPAPPAAPSTPQGRVPVPPGGRPVHLQAGLVAEELHGCTISARWEGHTVRGVVDSYTLRMPAHQALRVYFEGGQPWPLEPVPAVVTVQALPLTNATFPGPATLYYQGDFGMAYRKVEVRDVELFFRPYAQYSAAVRVTFTPRGARTQREMWLTYKPTLVILAGHGHPAPDGMWTELKSAGPGVETQMSRHMAFSEEWTNEAREMIAAYAARSGARVLADLHGYNAHRKLTEAELAAWDAVRGDERREAY